MDNDRMRDDEDMGQTTNDEMGRATGEDIIGKEEDVDEIDELDEIDEADEEDMEEK